MKLGIKVEHEQDGCLKGKHKHPKVDNYDARPLSLIDMGLIFLMGLIVGAVFL